MAAGAGRLRQTLQGFPATAVTTRVLDGVVTSLPGVRPLPAYTSVEEAAATVFGGIPPDLLLRAVALCEAPGVDRALTLARSIDTGDAGIAVLTGVRSALALFRGGDVARIAALAGQQRTDAALKAVSLAVITSLLLDGPAAGRLEILRSVPSGQQLLQYFGAIDVALPFYRELSAGADAVELVAGLVADGRTRVAELLLAVVGRQGLSEAEVVLDEMVGALGRSAQEALPHAQQIATRLGALLPNRGGDLFDLVAAGADALPCYTYLVARLAVESRLALAKLEAMPEVDLPSPPPPPAPVPAPPPFVATAQGKPSDSALGREPADGDGEETDGSGSVG